MASYLALISRIYSSSFRRGHPWLTNSVTGGKIGYLKLRDLFLNSSALFNQMPIPNTAGDSHNLVVEGQGLIAVSSGDSAQALGAADSVFDLDAAAGTGAVVGPLCVSRGGTSGFRSGSYPAGRCRRTRRNGSVSARPRGRAARRGTRCRSIARPTGYDPGLSEQEGPRWATERKRLAARPWQPILPASWPPPCQWPRAGT